MSALEEKLKEMESKPTGYFLIDGSNKIRALLAALRLAMKQRDTRYSRKDVWSEIQKETNSDRCRAMVSGSKY